MFSRIINFFTSINWTALLIVLIVAVIVGVLLQFFVFKNSFVGKMITVLLVVTSLMTTITISYKVNNRQLPAPKLILTETDIEWNNIKDAKEYVLNINDDTIRYDFTTNTITLESVKDKLDENTLNYIKVKAISGSSEIKDSEYSNIGVYGTVNAELSNTGIIIDKLYKNGEIVTVFTMYSDEISFYKWEFNSNNELIKNSGISTHERALEYLEEFEFQGYKLVSKKTGIELIKQIKDFILNKMNAGKFAETFDLKEFYDVIVGENAVIKGFNKFNVAITGEIKHEILKAPILTLTASGVNWSTNNNANGYEVLVNDTVLNYSNEITSLTMVELQEICNSELVTVKVKALGNDIKYLDSEYSNIGRYGTVNAELSNTGIIIDKVYENGEIVTVFTMYSDEISFYKWEFNSNNELIKNSGISTHERALEYLEEFEFQGYKLVSKKTGIELIKQIKDFILNKMNAGKFAETFDLKEFYDVIVGENAVIKGFNKFNVAITGEIKHEILKAPILTLTASGVNWSTNNNANGYEVLVNDTVLNYSNEITSLTMVELQEICNSELVTVKVKALGNDIKYLDSEYSNIGRYGTVNAELSNTGIIIDKVYENGEIVTVFTMYSDKVSFYKWKFDSNNELISNSGISTHERALEYWEEFEFEGYKLVSKKKGIELIKEIKDFVINQLNAGEYAQKFNLKDFYEVEVTDDTILNLNSFSVSMSGNIQN